MSLYDMIPDKLMVVPTGGHKGDKLSRKDINLYEYVCAYCGERFYRKRKADALLFVAA